MKHLNSSAYTTSGVGFIPTSGTLDFIQAAYTEGLTATVLALIGSGYDSTKLYRLWGVVVTYSAGVWTITKGAIFWNGEIYQIPAQTVNTPTSLTWNILTTQYTTNADPATYTDGSTHNVHDIRTLAFVAASVGSPTVANNLLDIRLNATLSVLSGSVNGQTLNFIQSQTLLYSTAVAGSGNAFTLDFTNGVPNNKLCIFLQLSSCTGITISGGAIQLNSTPTTAITTGMSSYCYEITYLGTDPTGRNYIKLEGYGS